MKKPTKRRSKYFAPQTEDTARKCDHPGCNEPGEYRAPKDRRLKEYYWFCLKHVQEYNAKWNYYDGLDEEEAGAHERSRMHFKFGSRIKYNFGFDFKGNFEFFDDYQPDFSAMNTPYFNEQERKCLKIMELSEEGLTVEIVKKQYKKLVKKYHPDVNRDDADAEEKFKLFANSILPFDITMTKQINIENY